MGSLSSNPLERVGVWMAMGEGCDKPLESCLQFGAAAEHVARTGRGRAISQEEALEILHQAEEVGLVLQPANDKEALCETP